jgi:hypothetical protein
MIGKKVKRLKEERERERRKTGSGKVIC